MSYSDYEEESDEDIKEEDEEKELPVDPLMLEMVNACKYGWDILLPPPPSQLSPPYQPLCYYHYSFTDTTNRFTIYVLLWST